MKKLILVFAVLLTIISCNPDEDIEVIDDGKCDCKKLTYDRSVTPPRLVKTELVRIDCIFDGIYLDRNTKIECD